MSAFSAESLIRPEFPARENEVLKKNKKKKQLNQKAQSTSTVISGRSQTKTDKCLRQGRNLNVQINALSNGWKSPVICFVKRFYMYTTCRLFLRRFTKKRMKQTNTLNPCLEQGKQLWAQTAGTEAACEKIPRQI